MTNIEQAADIISYRQYQETGKVNAPLNPGSVAEHLSMAGLLTPAPQIIRTVDELEALDPDALIGIPRDYGDCDQPRLAGWVRTFYPLGESSPVFPAVVVATGAQVRAARTALQEATE